jgi:ATP-dependent protease Clp ATPase subunit
MRQPANSNDNSLLCSFCGKSQEKTGKLISSPNNLPRAYICDECVAICAAIIEDDKGEPKTHLQDMHEGSPSHPLFAHPLAYDLIEAIDHWMREQSLGNDGLVALAKVSRIASQILREDQQKNDATGN